jgi:hypothetical protein
VFDALLILPLPIVRSSSNAESQASETSQRPQQEVKSICLAKGTGAFHPILSLNQSMYTRTSGIPE